MSRAQVLNVGDIVQTPKGRGHAVQVTQQYVAVFHPEHGHAFISPRDQVSRVGGELQLADPVTVQGSVIATWHGMEETLSNEPGIIVDTLPADGGTDFLVYVPGRMTVYECHADQLGRTVNVEALA